MEHRTLKVSLPFSAISCAYSSQLDTTMSDMDCGVGQSVHIERKFISCERSLDDLFRLWEGGCAYVQT